MLGLVRSVLAALVAIALPGLALAAGDVGRGRALLERAECTRCHKIPGLEEPARETSCSACHLWIMATAGNPAATAEARSSFPLWDRHVERVKAGHFTQGVPSLLGAGRRLRPEWLRGYLASPYDVRPNLSESMIRPAFTPAELDDAVAFLTADAARLEKGPVPPADPALVAAGARLFEEKGCAVCHLLGNRRFPAAGSAQLDFAPYGPRALAPDLRHARHRLRPEAIVPWLLAPQSLKPDTTMPALGLTAADALALGAFVLHGEPGTAAAPAARGKGAPRGPPTFREVDERVLSRVCIHCHMDPASNAGDGGPGNTGGFGYRAIGLSFESYAQLAEGSAGPDGARRSIFRKGESGEAVLVELLRRRIVENERDRVLPGHDDLRDRRAAPSTAAAGMPMGLPALGPDELALVEAWVAAGHPGPPAGDDGRSAYYGPPPKSAGAGTAAGGAGSHPVTREGSRGKGP